MNILVASIQLPWPLDSGGKVALYASLSSLRNDHRFTVISPIWDEKGMSDAAELQSHFPEIKIHGIYCGYEKPVIQPVIQPKENILSRALSWGGRQFSTRIDVPEPVVVAEEKGPSFPYYPFSPLPEKYLSALSIELSRGIDLVQAEFVEMLSLGAWLPPEIPKLFIHHQLHFVYAKRFSTAQTHSAYSEYLENVMAIQEKAYVNMFDGIVVFSEEDKQALSEMVEKEKVYVSPFPILERSVASAEQCTAHFTFVGSDAHFPNRDALEWLTTEVWPEISKQIPGCVLKVIGPWGEASKARLLQPGIEFTGYVPDLENAVRGSVMLVPLRIGSGIRVKLLDAMAQGVPAVSTSIGCEGIPVTDGVDILIRDDASQFAAAAISLFNDPELRMRLGSAGRDLIVKHYSPEQVRKRRNEIYERVCGQASRLNKPGSGAARP